MSKSAAGKAGAEEVMNFRRESASVELLKWFAFVGMLVDHLSKSATTLSWLSNGAWWCWGRMAFPLFALTFAWAVVIAKGGVLQWRRLLWLGVLAQPAHMLVFGSPWWALNVMFVFPAGWAVWKLGRHGGIKASMLLWAVIVLAGFLFGPESYGFFGVGTVTFALIGWSVSGWKRYAWLSIALACWMPTVAEGWIPLLGLLVIAVPLWSLPVPAVPLRRWARGGFGWWYAGHLWIIWGVLATSHQLAG